MTIDHAFELHPRRPISRLRVVWKIVCRSTLLGLIAGAVLGGIFGFFYFLATVPIGAVLGLGLGFVNGIVLSLVTVVGFYPLRQVEPYRSTAKAIAAIVGQGAALYAPLSYASIPMTPSSALLIGFSTVLISAIALIVGRFVGDNIAQWYAEIKGCTGQTLLHPIALHNIALHKTKQRLEAMLSPREPFWIQAILMTILVCPFLGMPLLGVLVCGIQDQVECLPSPRLYTSMIEGFKVLVPILLGIWLTVVMFRRYYRICLEMDRDRIIISRELFGYRIWKRSGRIQDIVRIQPICHFGTYCNVVVQVESVEYELRGEFTLLGARLFADELRNWIDLYG